MPSMDAAAIQNIPVESKSHIQKVMFLCAVARPLFDETGKCIFDGKVRHLHARWGGGGGVGRGGGVRG